MMPMRGSDDEGRDHKLKSYDGKDYSEIIEFPVELVDRDGVVRRYSYEESLAVYHRRIQSAPWRYGDDALIRAEIGHCSRRIDQIKRSHVERARSGVVVASSDPRASLGPGYELLRRFYRDGLRERGLRLDGEVPLRLALLDDSPACRVYHVGFPEGRSDHLLYVYPFDFASDSDRKGAFHLGRDRFRGQLPAPGVERLLLDEEGGDAGYLITGTSELPEGLVGLARAGEPDEDEGSFGDSAPEWIRPEGDRAETPWRGASFERGVEALRGDRPDEALEDLRRAVQENPWHRESYLALLAVLDGAGLHEEAEMYGTMAAHYLGEDGLVQYRRGISMVRQGRVDEAVQSFDRAGSLDGSLYQPGYFAAHLLLARGRDLDGAIRRMEEAARVAPPELRLPTLVRSLRFIASLRRLLQWGGLGVAFAALLLWSSGRPIGGIIAPIALLTALGARRFTAALARRILQRRMQQDLVPGQD